MKFIRVFLVLAFSVASITFSIMHIVNAQTVLQAGSTNFAISPIVLHSLEFSGDLNHLRIYWDATYLTGIQDLGVKCYLNCNPLENPQKCDGYPQNCTYVGPPGNGVCTIQPVQYSYPLNTPENATCIFYLPSNPDIHYFKTDGTYPNATFYPINFNLYLSPNFTVTVGKQLSLSLVVQNIGVFTDNYTQVIRAYPGNFVALDSKTANTGFGPLVGNSFGNTPQVFVSLAKFTILSTTAPVNIIIDVNSTTNSTINQEQVVQIRAGISSLPDFGWTGVVQIAVIAALVLFLVRRKL